MTTLRSFMALAIAALACTTPVVSQAQWYVDFRNLDKVLGMSIHAVLADLKGFEIECTSEPAGPLSECSSLFVQGTDSSSQFRATLKFQNGRLLSIHRVVSSDYTGVELFRFIGSLGKLLSAQPGAKYEATYSELREADGSTLQTARFLSGNRRISVTYAFDLKDDKGQPMQPFVQVDESFTSPVMPNPSVKGTGLRPAHYLER